MKNLLEFYSAWKLQNEGKAVILHDGMEGFQLCRNPPCLYSHIRLLELIRE